MGVGIALDFFELYQCLSSLLDIYFSLMMRKLGGGGGGDRMRLEADIITSGSGSL